MFYHCFLNQFTKLGDTGAICYLASANGKNVNINIIVARL